MKIFIYILLVLASALLIYNITALDFAHLSGNKSIVALIGIVACLSVILLLTILLQSKRIAKKLKERK